MRALRPRVVMYFGQGHTAGKLQSQDWNPSSLILFLSMEKFKSV